MNTDIFKSLVAFFGGQTNTANALHVTQGSVCGWVSGKHGMHPLTALKAENVTGGRFAAKELCPRLADVIQPQVTA